MAKETAKKRTRKRPLTRERVFEAAIALADAEGAEALTMRKLAQKLGVEAMSLYHHVADKEAILDGMVEAVFAEIELPVDLGWKDAMRERCGRLRAALLRHPWAVSLLDARVNPGPATLGHQEWVFGTLYANGFSVPLAATAAATLDAYVYGFAIQELALPFDTSEELAEALGDPLEMMPADAYPSLARMVGEYASKPGYAFSKEFPRGLELILDGFERALAEA